VLGEGGSGLWERWQVGLTGQAEWELKLRSYLDQNLEQFASWFVTPFAVNSGIRADDNIFCLRAMNASENLHFRAV